MSEALRAFSGSPLREKSDGVPRLYFHKHGHAGSEPPDRALGCIFWPARSMQPLSDGPLVPGAAPCPGRTLLWQRHLFNPSAGPKCVLAEMPVWAPHKEAAGIG